MPPLETRDDPAAQDDKGPALTTVSVLFTVLAFITTVLRLCVRRGRRALGWDDYIIAIAMALTVIEAALTIQAVTRGKGKRAANLSKAQIQYINMYSCTCLGSKADQKTSTDHFVLCRVRSTCAVCSDGSHQNFCVPLGRSDQARQEIENLCGDRNRSACHRKHRSQHRVTGTM